MMGFNFWLFLGHGLLPGVISNGKKWVKRKGIPETCLAWEQDCDFISVLHRYLEMHLQPCIPF